jgi:hypothetical protein
LNGLGIYLVNKQKNGQEEFYIRRSASTVALTLREAVQFVQEHWKKTENITMKGEA